MHADEGKLNLPLRTIETEVIMVLLIFNILTGIQ